ncbi:DUF1048 domain-containing protein [Acidaminobacter sp. JC074]|uniref:DUF1048 domain-containing protein n=1 Tax=Acidaminobacter sp. JC074 TaxID=2530199 RepID=UPI001F0F84A8|nr:DUF1048 domain-containing protein [Acidaminobacter sp. JC074]MCH4886113.1 DUF1048 domain-containing protein [Acidaminobacter sp. JC074]
MNRTGKSRVVMTILLSVLLIVQMLVFMVNKKESNMAIFLMFGLIVLLALISVFMSIYKLKELKDRISSLPESYKAVYVDAQESIDLSNLSSGMKQDIKTAVLEIFEHASMDQRDVESVIDGDLNKFLEPFISAGGGNFSILYLMAYSLSLFVGYIILMKVYKMTKIGFSLEAIESSTLDFGIVISYAIIAFVFFPWLMYLMRKASVERWSNVKRLWIICPVLLPIGILFVLIGVENDALRAFLDKELSLLDSPLKLLSAIVIFLLSLYLVKLSRKKQITN